MPRNLSQRAQSTSCLDLNTPTDIDKLRNLLPSYRPAPDYETAIQQKYRNSASAIQNFEPLQNTHAILYSSQPEIHQAEAFASHLRYPDVTHNNIEQKNILASLYNPAYTQSQVLSTNNRQNIVDITENMRFLHLYKPPPPYPSNKISSNSTPDLAGISQQIKPQTNFINSLVSGSSPDLVSSGNFYNQGYLKHYGGQILYNGNHPNVHRSQSYLPPQHATYENLASIFNNNMLGRAQALIVDNPNVTKHIKKVYDEHGNIIYCMPANMKQILQENQLPSTGFVFTHNKNAVVAHSPNLGGSTEPIYENIPLPWQNDSDKMRARTQSINSAPEINYPTNLLQTPNIQHLNLSSQENLYANINHNVSGKSSRTDLNTQNSSKQNLEDNSSIISRTGRSLTPTQTSVNSHSASNSPQSLSRTNTFIINKNLMMNSTPKGNTFIENANSKNETYTVSESSSLLCTHNSRKIANAGSESFPTDSSSSSKSGSGKKKRRWGILMGRSKSNEKVKSATLGREKEKTKDKGQNNRHRWSTDSPRLHPLPPSISKETMVSSFSCLQIQFRFCKLNIPFYFIVSTT